MKHVLASAFVLVILAHTAAAQPSPLDGYVALALRQNPALQGQRIEAARAGTDVREALARYRPAVTFDARYTRTSGNTLDFGQLVNPVYGALNALTGTQNFPSSVELGLPLRQETKVRVAQPLFQPALGPNVRLRRALVASEVAEADALARTLAADVQSAYLDVLRARAGADLLGRTLPLLDENLRVSERLVAAGRATDEVTSRARAERSAVVQQRDEAVQNALAAAQNFNRLLDRPLDAPVATMPDSALARRFALPDSSVLAGAPDRRSELDALDAAIGARRQAERLARADALPGVAFALDYGFQGQDYNFRPSEDYVAASVVLTWNAFDGFARRARTQGARLDTDALRARRREAERGIELEIATGYGAARVAGGAIATADDRLASARRTYTLVERRYAQGAAPQIEVLQARTDLTNAETNRLLTFYGALRRVVALERAAALRPLPTE